jgi:hypothetical protein
MAYHEDRVSGRALQPEAIAAYTRIGTGEKILINPNVR